MKTVDEMDVDELRLTLNEVADVFSIGDLARDRSTILTNVTNTARHEFCIQPPSDDVIALARDLAVGDPVRAYVMDAAGWRAYTDDDDD